eukprot:19712-Heterococcus_DN1.PRE.1
MHTHYSLVSESSEGRQSNPSQMLHELPHMALHYHFCTPKREYYNTLTMRPNCNAHATINDNVNGLLVHGEH